jgi:pimeloyl-ACP methyl ester carboxylesterase
MVFTQPVCYEFQNIKVPVLLIIGTRDRMAIGVSKEVAATLGQYQLLGKLTKDKIANSELTELDQVGHLPQLKHSIVSSFRLPSFLIVDASQ